MKRPGESLKTPLKRTEGGLVQIGRASFRNHLSLRTRSEFENVKKSGERLAGRSIILLKAESPDGILRLGIICGRKFDGRAVARNRAKRIVREAFRLVRNGVGVAHLVAIPKKSIKKSTAAEVQRELVGLLSEAGLWKERQEF